MVSFRKALVIMTSVTFSFVAVPAAHAASPLVSSVDVNTGFTSIRMKTGDYETTLDSTMSLEANYNLKHAAWSTAYSMSFFELIEAQGRKLPYSRFALGIRWYPMGMNGGRLILDQGVQAQVWKSTPFIGLSMGVANASVDRFNATMTDISPRFGVELPVSSNFFLQGQLVISSGTGGGSGAAASTAKTEYQQISYSGLSAMIGVIYSGL